MRSNVWVASAAFAVASLGTMNVAVGQDWAKANLAKSPRHGEYVTLDEPGGRKVQAWVVYPEVKDKAPVVVMIHEIFGLSDWAREMADELAGAGYIVVEPDMLSGLGPNVAASAMPQGGTAQQAAGVDHAHMQMPGGSNGAAFVPAQPGGTTAFPDQGSITKAVSSLPDAQVLGDLDAAADYGKKLPAANGKVFVGGFCWGGGKTFLFATHRKDLSGAFVFYGPPPATDLMKNINAPVYGFYAGNDARITSTVAQTEADMKAAGKTYEPVTYDGAGHGFMRAGEAPDANAANTAARQAGFRRLVSLLGGVR
ncbi:MAG TPA: dienelactone hydrolase family protein [Acidobacteriaceae bacterium]|jgi:carboxymethylenebutenolidase|nr:dienelactone hydrolase family protein [Acidobacteriaceae bacterium]